MRIDPNHLGPLSPEAATPGAPGDLFPGASRYLSKRQLARAARTRDLVAERVGTLLEPGETVLYLAPAHQLPGLWDSLGFGVYAYAYHTVALVLTDRRILEVLLDYSGKRLSTRTRSFPWGEAKTVTFGWRGLAVTSHAGKTHRWKVPVRGDRKVLGLLVSKVRERLLGVPSLSTAPWPAWHCPACAASLAPKARACDACGTAFKSKTLATWLALAFPGAGLYYAGHPVLGTTDLLGELILFTVVVAAVADAASWVDMLPVFMMGLFFFVMTKSESIHLSRVLVDRTKPATEEEAGRWRRLAVGGAVASLAALLVLPAARGRTANPIDHDLVFADPDQEWLGSFDRSEWRRFADEPLARSEWVNDEDGAISVLAEPLRSDQSFDDFAREIDAERRAEGQPPAERMRLGELDAVRVHKRFTADDGVAAISLRYYVFDPDGHDAHLVFWNVYADGYEASEDLLESLIATASFGPPQAMPAAGTVATAR